MELSQELAKTDIKTPEIAFIGTFDLRKGAREFPEIINAVSKKIPNVKFKLIGTSAMFPTKESILHYLPAETHPFVEIIPKFKPEDLKKHIANSTLGIFPSHMESFGFGVLEMMTAGLPVVAYNVPGPNELLPQSLLVPRNDYQEMCSKLVKLIQDEAFYIETREACLERSKRFNWNEIGRNVSMLYLNEIQKNNKRNV
jgi:glycosyltransferase involved in cell wall biosynthesis